MSHTSVDSRPVSRGFGTWMMSWLIDIVGTRMVGTPERGALTIVYPDGHSRTIGNPTTGFHATLKLNNLKVVGQTMRRGTVGFAAAYINGDIEVDDLTAVFRFFLENYEQLAAASHGMFRAAAHDIAYHLSRANTKERAKENISEHYDLGNDFYAEWLDPSMTYSSAIFQSGDMSLEKAQHEKYHHVADAAGIKEGDDVLEIGCGWGGLAEVVARDYNANLRGITLSREQLKYAIDRIERQGLSNHATLVFEDYRDTEGQFDHVCSIEMIEAVGEEHWPVYFQTIFDRLKAGGTAAIQAITIDEEAFKTYRANPDFIQRYIFPGGMLPTPQILDNLTARQDLKKVDELVFPQDYARTLKLWRERFQDAWDQVRPLGFDNRFKHMWEFYLHYCEAGFGAEFIDVRQIVYARD
jgi:cyclopropane-fatty-acyl-phospholipid synthase